MEEPLVSICVPTYNAQRYLAESLTSVVNQTYQNIEILIVDDGSTDQTGDIISEFAQKYPQIRSIKNERNIGLVENWNKCLKEARGEWIKFHFHDDLAQSVCIEEMVNSIKYTAHKLVLCDREYFFEEGVPETLENFLSNKVRRLSNYFSDERNIVGAEMFCELWYQHLLGNNILGEPIVGLFNKQAVKKYGFFDKSLKQIVDFEYWARIANSEGFIFLNKPLVSFRVHNNSTTALNARYEVKPSVIDRYILAHKIKHDSYFEPFRRYVGANKGDLNKKLDKILLSRMNNQAGLLKAKLRLLENDYRGIIPNGFNKRLMQIKLANILDNVSRKIRR
jgi:glycosyltransferase involved in cell wall biosynthesis